MDGLRAATQEVPRALPEEVADGPALSGVLEAGPGAGVREPEAVRVGPKAVPPVFVGAEVPVELRVSPRALAAAEVPVELRVSPRVFVDAEVPVELQVSPRVFADVQVRQA